MDPSDCSNEEQWTKYYKFDKCKRVQEREKQKEAARIAEGAARRDTEPW